ncbi:hypothetical protein N658DRAFT_500207 [Parathielavia hyrcaniae]|uniref:Heterokaryon incompatibility domain-containing protein n=1 Tax=Parathielavia hyrcaniae TaxID=113614 RepID=A0AAN6SY53_9PEZI|nr:hypothetical protein N658DRAFT_500207 [Parathielavia hyrcaniae]
MDKTHGGKDGDDHGYSYDPLPVFHSFRTLELLPGSGDDSLRCNLRVHVNETVDYEIISYVWGKPEKSHSIRVNGKRMAITANLHAVLRRLRLPDRPRVLWADGICINQADDAEKGRQVSRMGLYYQWAGRALVYLGEEADGSERIPALIDAIHRSLNPRLSVRIQPHSPLIPPGLPPPDDEGWLALSSLLLRPWWGRYWIIQEAVKPRVVELVCGGWTMDWERFAEANRAVQHVRKPVERPGEAPDHMHERTDALRTAEMNLINLVVLRNGLVREEHPVVTRMLDGSTKTITVHKHRPTWQLIDLLERCRRGRATDERDYIYAMLGLCVEDSAGLLQAPGLDIDYKEPAGRTFTRFAKHIVTWGGAIKLLYSASASNQVGLGAARRHITLSWVPDWSARGGPMHVLSPRDDGGVNKYYLAGSPTVLAPKAELILDDGAAGADGLRVCGVVVGYITQTGAAAPDPGPVDPRRFTMVMHRDMDTIAGAAGNLVRFLASDLRTSPPHLEYVWRTLCCDVDLLTGRPILEAVDGETSRSGFSAFCRLWPLYRDAVFGGGAGGDSGDDGWLFGRGGADLAALASEMPLLQEPASDFTKKTAPLCLGRRVAVLDDVGQPAQVPRASEPGDAVFIPMGSAVPFVVRPVQEDYVDGRRTTYFRLVGECYVHGAMMGEMMIPERKELEHIVLV